MINRGKYSCPRDTGQIAACTVKTVSDRRASQKGPAGGKVVPHSFGKLFSPDGASERFLSMKEMRFSLDIIFFDSDRKLSEVLPDLLRCDECRQCRAPANTACALKSNAGLTAALGTRGLGTV